MEKIIENVYHINLGMVNAYLIKSANGLILIDSGPSPSIVNKLENELSDIGESIENIKMQFITHGHSDHIGGIPALKTKLGFTIYALEGEAPYIEGAKLQEVPKGSLFNLVNWLGKVFPNTKVTFKVDQTFKIGENLSEIYPGMMIIGLTGHTPGQCGIYLKNENLLFSGDSINTRKGDLGLPMKPATTNMNKAEDDIRKIADMELDILCPGHGMVLKENTTKIIRRYADSL